MTIHDNVLEDFFTLSLDLLCIADADGYFRKLSPSWNILGYTLDELMGQRYISFIHPDDVHATLEAVSQLQATQPISNFSNRYRCRDGSYRLLEWRAQQRDNLIYAVGRDITEINKAENALKESEHRFRVISEMISNYTYGFVFNDDGSFHPEWVAGAFETITGYTFAEINERGGWATLIHPDDSAVVTARLNRLLAGQESVDEFRLVTASGDIRWIRDYGKPIWDEQKNRLSHIFGAAQDITTNRLAEQHKLELATERERINILTDFITATSHELRTPLSVINTSLYLLMLTHIEERRQEKAKQIADQVNYLNRVINQLHEVVRLDRIVQLDLVPISLDTVIATFTEELRHKYPQTPIQATIMPNLPIIRGNHPYIQIVLNQLLENAVQFSPEYAPILILVIFDNQEVAISIQDKGIGIASGHLEKIFIPLYKVDSARTKNQNGVGVGLTIVKRIMQLHHGRITVQSVLGEGSIFTLYFPVTTVE